MLERVLQKLPLEAPDRSYGAHYDDITLAMKGIEREFGVSIPDSEIGFLEDLLYTV
jgi:transcriptional regulatory protein LevR